MTWAHLEAQFASQFILSFELREARVRAAARFYSRCLHILPAN